MRSDRTTYNLLDFDFIARRRAEIGLSTNALGRFVGMSASSLADFERGRSQAGIRVDTIIKLARALETEPANLLQRDEREEPAPERDDIRLEAAMLQSRRQRPLADYQRPLGMSSLQLRRAADRLGQRLEATGAELRGYPSFSIQPRGGVLTRQELRKLKERQSRRPALRLDQIRVLQQVMTGEVETIVFDGSLKGGNLWSCIGYLLRNGYIRDKDGRYEVTERVYFSLGRSTRKKPPRRVASAG